MAESRLCMTQPNRLSWVDSLLGAVESISVRLLVLERSPLRDGRDGKEGRDGIDGKPGEAGPQGEPGEKGEPGPSGGPGDPGPAGEPGPVGPQGDRGPPGPAGVGERGVQGEPGMPGRDGRDGSPGEKGIDGKDGRDGADGLGFDDLDIQYDGERTFTFKLDNGERSKKWEFVMPVALDRGIWTERNYQKGDIVSWGGSMFIAQEDTKAKPDLSKDWRMAVRRGRDGKDGKPGKDGERGPEGKPGKNGGNW